MPAGGAGGVYQYQVMDYAQGSLDCHWDILDRRCNQTDIGGCGMNHHHQRILDYMRTHGSITQGEADTISVKRLSARIMELRGQGLPIVTELERGKNKYGEAVRYARYRMGARA